MSFLIRLLGIGLLFGLIFWYSNAQMYPVQIAAFAIGYAGAKLCFFLFDIAKEIDKQNANYRNGVN